MSKLLRTSAPSRTTILKAFSPSKRSFSALATNLMPKDKSRPRHRHSKREAQESMFPSSDDYERDEFGRDLPSSSSPPRSPTYPPYPAYPSYPSYMYDRSGSRPASPQPRGPPPPWRQDSPSRPTQDQPGPSAPELTRRWKSPTPPPFVPGSPTEEYMASASLPSTRLTEPGKKLLILDLNGTLVYRSPRRDARKKRVMTARPYITAFAAWIFHPGSNIDTMIWSSAQPENVELMGRYAFFDRYDRLRAVWARDTLGLSSTDYRNKVQTVKNLDKVWAALPFSVENTLLLDDSVLKAHMQPYNHLILQEFDRELKNRDVEDATLVAVVGILSHAVLESNVASWIRSGGLHRNSTPSKSDGAEETGAESGSPGAAPVSSTAASGVPPVPANGEDPVTGTVSFWYDDADTFAYWVQQGKAELERLSIPIE